MNWETVIGLEIHAQLSTRSKMFSAASTQFGAPPNAQACSVDIALPGVLPVANRGAVERAIRFGLAIGADISRRSVFARKNYFYPDLPKGYQISQFELPIVRGGSVPLVLEEGEKSVRLTRAHLEEDAGKSLHEDFHGMSGIDLNRAGTPLLEIVSEPDMRSAREAVAYARAIHSLLRWIDICDGNMQEGSFRCDANVSVRPKGSDRLGTRREIKNLNSFRFLQQAIEYEAKWQIERLEDGGKIEQATVLFDPDTGETRAMRTKEEAHDYRYFPDPDLLPLEVAEQWIERVRRELPELPGAIRARYQREFGLSAYDAGLLTQSRETAEYFDDMMRRLGVDAAKTCANWITVDLAAALNREGLEISRSPVASDQLAQLLARVRDGSISMKIAKDVFQRLWSAMVPLWRSAIDEIGQDRAPEEVARRIAASPGRFSADGIIAAAGLTQISDAGELERIVDDVLERNPRSVEEFRAGKEKALNALVGQAMKATGGKGNPAQINEILRRRLAG